MELKENKEQITIEIDYLIIYYSFMVLKPIDIK